MPTRKYRHWPIAEKRRIVELSLQPHTSANEVAKRFDLDPPTLSSWRTLYRNCKLEATTQNQMIPDPQKILPVTITPSSFGASGKTNVRINMPSGVSIVIESDTMNYAELGGMPAMIQS